ncbi:MAG TPA: hypothetical protein VGI56_02595, partial [Galbitalea sp.]
VGAIRRQSIACLGVSDFGQSGDIDDLYAYFGIDTDTIVGAAVDLVEDVGRSPTDQIREASWPS